MQLPGSAVARDQRASLYLADTEAFFTQLYRELRRLEVTANRLGVRAAVRLNGTSDIPWERLHRNVFLDFPDTAFFDYTKIRPRMHSFLSGYIHFPSLEKVAWPKNYHLTFSGDGNRQEEAREVLKRGGNVALVFWPGLPNSWWGHLVIDGDEHDARFVDPRGVIVGLRAKGIARVELDGFVVRPCPECGETAQELQLVSVKEDTHRHCVHRCGGCGFECRSRWILPHALKRCDMRLPAIAA